MLNQLQGFKSQGVETITVENIKQFSSVYRDIYDLVIDGEDPVKNYQYMLSNYANRSDDVLSSLGAEFIDFIKQDRQSYYSIHSSNNYNGCKIPSTATNGN